MKKLATQLVLALAAFSAAGTVQAAHEGQVFGTQFRCGGSRVEEASQMKTAAAVHDIMLMFASSSGEFVSGVRVDLHNAKGELLMSAQCGGPIMLIDVPTIGEYRVSAHFNGVKKQQKMRVGIAGQATSNLFIW